MIEANKYRLGIFVITGMTLLLVILLLLGIADAFVPKLQLTTLFPESVQGLSKGSAVKFRGVPIGSVSHIAIQPRDKLIRVEMEVNISSFGGDEMSESEKLAYFEDFLRKQRDAGLRCRLEFIGITGMKYIEMDFFEGAERNIIPDDDTVIKGIYIPSVPSTFSDILKSFTNAMERVSQIRFDQISVELEGVLVELRAVLENPHTKELFKALAETGENLRQSTQAINENFSKEKLESISNNLDQALVKMNKLADKLTDDMEKAELAESMKAFRNMANSISSLRSQLNSTIKKTDVAMDSLNDLLITVDEDPSSVIFGKRKEKINFAE